MTYTWTARYGSDVVLAPAFQTLCAEVASHPRYRNLTNLGEIGDSRHKGQGTSSDHNPFVIAPRNAAYPGCGYIRAADFGGDRDTLLDLRRDLHDLYVAHDARLWVYGYFKGPDSLINDWGGDGWHTDTGDEGHLHVSITQKNGYAPSSNGWVPSLDSRKPWGLAPVIHTGPWLRHQWPTWIPTGEYFGLLSGPGRSHGGADAREAAAVKLIQQRLQNLGCLKAGNVDGRFTKLDQNAVIAWQRKTHRHVTGRINEAGWKALFTH